MNVSRAERLLRKAEKALITAIEAYNRPDCPYREETFAILALNAWELLLKAKLVHEADNDVRCLYVYETRTRKDGSQSKKLYLRRNRSGNPHTVGLGKTITELENKYGVLIDSTIKTNLDALTEIRDNAIHYVNAGSDLSKKVLEYGTASVKNYLELAKGWFNRNLSQYNLYLMPIGFITAPGTATGINVAKDEQRVIDYLTRTVEEQSEAGYGFHVALEVNLSLKRAYAGATAQAQVTRDPSAPKVQVSEEDIRKQYPWDYDELTIQLRKRYIDFLANQEYHDIRKPLRNDRRYVNIRYLDPGNIRSAKKDYYNPNIIDEFDKHYTRK